MNSLSFHSNFETSQPSKLKIKMVALIAGIIRLQLLFPLVLCSSGLTVLTPSENTERMEKCGKSRNQSDYILNLADIDGVILFVSPRHFIADVSLIKGNYNKSECKSDDNYVTGQLSTSVNISAKLIGECGDVPVGFVLGEFHQESNTPRTDYLCIEDKEVPVGSKIHVVTADGRFENGRVVNCNNPKPSILCVSTQPRALGAILFGNKLVGQSMQSNDYGSIIVEYLYNQNDAIRKSAGIYIENGVSTKIRVIRAQSGDDTTAGTQADTTARTKADTTAQTRDGTTARTEADTTARPGADTTAQPRADTTAQPRADTTARPGADTTAQPQMTIIKSKTKNNVPIVKITPRVNIPISERIPPRVELSKEKVDCDDDSLCFNEDIYASTCGAVSIFFSFFLVFLMVN